MTSPSAADSLSDDAFLGGRLRLLQPRQGYRAGIDPVLLAASVPAEPGQSVLELGVGVGAAILCLSARVEGLRLSGVEVQPDYARLAEENAARNGVALDLHLADIADLPAELRDRQFDLVIMNPPYYRPGARTAAPDQGRERALAGADLALWADVAIRRLAPGGRLTLIYEAEALPALLGHLDGRVGGVMVRPVVPRASRPARRILLTCRKGARAPFSLLAPLTLHSGAVHERDGDDYTSTVSAILRDGASLSWQDG